MREKVVHFRTIPRADGTPSQAVFTPEEIKQMRLQPHAKGGLTCVALFEDGEEVPSAIAYATTSPRDNFSKRLGRIIARGRAELELTGEMERRRERRRAAAR